jgi:hypothetical protein
MIPVKQTKRGGPDVPPEERGDCWPACLASLLEVPLEDVPIPHDDRHWWDVTQEALAPHGYEAVHMDEKYWPAGYWIAAVPSRNLGPGVKHVVVMRGGEVAHDPALGERYEVGTFIDDMKIHAAYVLVPLEPVSLRIAA